MKQVSILIALALTVALLAVANLLWGSLSIPIEDVWRILCGEEIEGHASWTYIIRQSRVPQMITAILCGASLSTCGLMLQTTFRNPLSGPSILGIDSGANLAVAIVMLLLGGTVTLGSLSIAGYLLVVMAAMVGALCIMMLLMLLSRILHSKVMLLISFILWGMGNFSNVSMDRLPLFSLLILIGLFMALLMIKPLDALLLGDRYAQNLGIRIQRVRQGLLLITGILTATTTAFCGPISFLGLAVPHIARLTLGTSIHRVLLPGAMLMGAILTLICNLLSTLPRNGSLIPINVITPIIGSPVILYVILKRDK